MVLFVILSAVCLANPKLDAIYRISVQRDSPRKLKAYLWSDDPAIQISALQAIGTMRNRESVQVLDTLRKIKDPKVNVHFAKAAMLTPGSDTLCFKRLKDEKNPKMKALWMDCIGLQGSRKYLPTLLEGALNSNLISEDVERKAAIRAIGRLAARGEQDPTLAKPILLQQLKDINALIRREAAVALASHKMKKRKADDQEKILAAIKVESDPETMIHLIRMTRRLKIPQKRLNEWLTHSSPMVRTAAIKAHPKDAFIKEMVNDEAFHVRLAAIQALARSGKSLKGIIRKGATISALEDAKLGLNTNLAEAVAAIEAARIGDFSPFPLLANSRPTPIREAAVRLIDSNRSLLEYSLDDREPEVRKAAAETLMSKNPKPSSISKLLRSKDINLVKVAASELTRAPQATQEMELWKRLKKTQSSTVALLLIEALASLEKQGRSKQSASKVKKLLRPWMQRPERRFQNALRVITIAKGVAPPKRPPPPKAEDLQKAALIKGARIETTRGTIRLQFMPDMAPMAVKSFAQMAEQGFYDGIKFNRIAPNFVVQTGPKISEQNEHSIVDEPSSLPFVSGSVGMAMRVTRSRSNGRRRSIPDSGGRHFFIALSPQAHLMGKYTQFAEVVEGLNLARQLQPEDKITQVVIERTSK